MAQSRSWIGTDFTLDIDFQSLHQSGEIVFAVWQKEKAPTTEKVHLQFFVVFRLKKRLNGAKDALGSSQVHLEIARDPVKSVEYCQKEETRMEGPFCVGINPLEKKRSIVEMCRSMPISEILGVNPELWRNVRQMREIRQLYLLPRRTQPRAIFLQGPTGCGKSLICSILSDLKPCYFKNDSKWWCGYEQQEVVVWDEFRRCDAGLYLNMINHLPFQVETKGGMVHLNSWLFVFTSNLSLEEVFSDCGRPTMDAIKRRTFIYHF